MNRTSIAAFARKIFLPAIITLMALAGAQNAAAATCTVPGNSTVDLGPINIQSNAQVGDTIATTTRSYTVNCPADSYFQFDPNPDHTGHHLVFISDMMNSTLDGLWETGTAGIGIRVTNTTHNIVVSGNQCKDYSYLDKCKYAPSQYNPEAFALSFEFKYELVKTGPIAANTTLKKTYILGLSAYSLRDGLTNPSKAYTNASAIMLGSTTVVPATCTVLTRDISVPLPSLMSSALKPAGTTGGDTAFRIELQCSTGKNVYVTLTDATDPGNTSNQLTLASNSSAGGVKLRILNSGTPINFGADSTVIGNPGQWLVGSSANTSSIPLTVQYISTGTATPGTVSALATFTLSYQ